MKTLSTLLLVSLLVQPFSTLAHAEETYDITGDVPVALSGSDPDSISVEIDPSTPEFKPQLAGGKAEWQWTKFRIAEYVATGVLGGAAITAALVIPPPSTPNWKGGILVDDAVRNALRLPTAGARATADTVSSVMLYAIIAAPFAMDGVAWAAKKETGEAAFQVLMIDAQSMAVTGSMLIFTKDFVGRQRPDGSENVSFFSGHTALSFTGAGLVCSFHENVQPFGGGWADALPCAVAATAATATGALRIMADKHYFSDVMTGAAVGIFSGYVLPKLLHYNKKLRNLSVAPWADTTGGGVAVGGAW